MMKSASSTCLATHVDGREELTVVQCNATHETQHWKISNGTITSRLFPDRCVDGNPIDLSGVEGGYLLWPKPQYVNLGYNSTALQVRGVTFDLSNISSTLIWRAAARYKKLIDRLFPRWKKFSCILKANIQVLSVYLK